MTPNTIVAPPVVTHDYDHPAPCVACGHGSARRVDATPVHAGLCDAVLRSRAS
jgi:hypothetical protein